jgi:hypothetical protein
MIGALVRHLKTDPTETVALCFGHSFQLILVSFICKVLTRRRHCGLARHFKTDPTET